jgi:hypothetical protein
MLTVELIRSVPHGDSQVEIVCDEEGLDLLISHLEGLRDSSPAARRYEAGEVVGSPNVDRFAPEHFHFLSTEWGSGELSAEPGVVGSEIVHHLRVRPLMKTPTSSHTLGSSTASGTWASPKAPLKGRRHATPSSTATSAACTERGSSPAITGQRNGATRRSNSQRTSSCSCLTRRPGESGFTPPASSGQGLRRLSDDLFVGL